ncbi:MAG: sigma-54 dependent transcriptional regulator [Steroidobacteraceae bacterium]|jgi:two-component system response regulator PilR (NtrC family)|nr:sigma-54 dependent transcriptional regulator [Steroidobacteraceae bacterium]
MSRSLALIVDDEPDLCELLALTLARMDVDSRSVHDLAAARRELQRGRFDLCLTDMRLPDGDGLDLVDWMQQHTPATPVAVITAHGNVEAAVRALKAGAFDFVSKPLDIAGLRKLVTQAVRLADRGGPAAEARAPQLLGRSAAIEQLRVMIARVARSQAPVHIAGESGTGKELAARLIHAGGSRAANPFIAVNCGAIPAELMESELFGHRKGSFTGAVADKPGLVQAAEGGTLFLDEVADLPLPMQVKLLRLIQEKAVRAVGDQRETPVDVRILSATHRDLGELVAEGRFREDLFYRLNVIELRVPALREHLDDVPELVEAILARLARRAGVPVPRLAPEALQLLRTYRYPGNVRELENILERAMTLCAGEQIEAGDIQLRPAMGGAGDADEDVDDDASGGLGDQLEDVEREAIMKALEQTRFNKTAAAKVLGITFRALRYRIKKLGIE